MPEKNIIKFPKGFYFGASTSSHQVEGDNDNNWTEWELKNADKLARRAQKNFKQWNEVALDAQKQENYFSGKACDHFNLFEEDIYLLKKLGLNSYRFSLEWSRIEPEKGKFDKEAIDHYRKMIRVLRTYNIEPFVTLWHWTEPKWFAKSGGFANPKSVKYFARFARKVVYSFGDDVEFIITQNEPEIFTMNSYFRGIWPPQRKNIFTSLRVFNNLIRAHKAAYDDIKKINPHIRVGIAKNNTYFEAYKNKFLNKILKRIADKVWNEYYLNKISDHQDFIGLNYYFHNRINGWFNHNENRAVSDLGWELYPKGIFYTLCELKKYKKPIYITENGLADIGDKFRAQYIEKILKSVNLAIRDGVDVRGYMHWSLIDNFEWAEGFWPRFGLVEIDYETQERIPRESAYKYSELIKKYSDVS